MVAMQQWGEAHVPRTPGPRVLPVTVETGVRVRAGLFTPDGGIVAGPEVAFERTDTSETTPS